MPSRMIHFTISSLLLKDLAIETRDINEFFIGSIAPDAYSENRELRDKAHFFFDDHKNTRYIDINAFMEEYPLEYMTPFVQGYLYHLIIDKCWLRDIYDLYIKSKPICEQKILLENYYSDFHSLNYILTRKYDLRFGLKRIKESPIMEVDYNKVNDELDVFRMEFNETERQLKLFNIETIINFIEYCKSLLLNFNNLKQNNFGIKNNDIL